MNKVERNNYIDWLKGFAIILVVIGHCWLTPPQISWLIYRFHMPLFFSISGYLFKSQNNYLKFFTKKFKSLIIPYIIFFIISYIISILLLKNNLSIDQMFINLYLNGKYCTAVNNWSLWYLPLFFIVSNCFYFISKIKKQKILFIILIILFFITIPINLTLQKITISSYIPFSLQTIAPGLFFMLLGYLYKINSPRLKKQNLLISFDLFIIGILISINNYDQIIDIKTYQYMITAILIIQFIITITKKAKNKLICYLGKNTLIILGLHRIILFLFETYLRDILINLNLNNIIGCIIIVTTCLLIICSPKEIAIKLFLKFKNQIQEKKII
ncbi:MAG: acyltransferase [Bacilli bacterium]|nr:acyltransferase [Bacilli bacterium]